MDTKNITLEKLFEVGAHFGHQARRWNPRMKDYIYGIVDGVSVFDLAKTRAALIEALETLEKAVKENKTILFVGTKKQGKDKIKEVAEAGGFPYVNERWLGGTLTNFEQMQKTLRKLADMKTKRTNGDYKTYTKKERLLIDRDIEKMERFFGGVTGLTKLPDILFVLDTHKEMGAVKEAIRLEIETVGVVDSNADPNFIDWPIPMNDDASAAVEYLMDLVKQAVTAKPKVVSVKPKVAKKTKKAA